MEQLLRVTINLSATPVRGRYTLKFAGMDIVKSTPKTIIAKMNYGDTRYQKSDLLKIVSDFKNDQLIRLQFYTLCYSSQKEEAVEKLKKHLGNHISYLEMQNKHALSAYEAGPIIEK
jgi:hypothetical protein